MESMKTLIYIIMIGLLLTIFIPIGASLGFVLFSFHPVIAIAGTAVGTYTGFKLWEIIALKVLDD